MFMIYGTEGVLKLPDPNGFGGDVVLIRGREDQTVVENELPYGDNCRGLGPAEMAAAIAEGRDNLAHKNLAYHVLDIIETMMVSSEKKAFMPVLSTCKRPDPLNF